MSGIDTLIITGSNGFVGSSLLQYIDNLPTSFLPKKIVTVNRTLSPNHAHSLRSKIEFKDMQFDLTKPWNFEIPNATVVNLAADGSESSYTSAASETFISISRNLSKWAMQNIPKSIFHASSGACFGIVPLQTESVSNEFELEAMVKKGKFIRARLEAENFLTNSLENKSTKLVIGRLFSFVGPNLLDKKQYAISSFIESAFSSGRVIVKGNPGTIRSYLHETDMSHWIYKALDIYPIPSLIAIGSAVSVRMFELADLVAAETGTYVEYENPAASGDIYVADNLSTLECLGVSETRNWQDAVIECIRKAKESRN